MNAPSSSSSSSTAAAPGRRNLITDVPGLRVGHATDRRLRSGVTVVRCEPACTAGVDVRGGGPGVRETETLSPENLVGRVDAIVLSGGSVFGLGAADGVTAALSVQGIGLAMHGHGVRLPIVPAAVLHDLGNDGDKAWGDAPPYAALGRIALDAAAEDFALGRVGAGTGARAGTVVGGLGSASLRLPDAEADDGLIVGALVAVNPVGAVLMPDGRTFWAWPFELDGEFGAQRPDAATFAGLDSANPVPAFSRLGASGRLQPGAATTLAVVACNADLTTAECKRVAMMAHDGLARAVRPAHTPFDGDVVFALATRGRALGAGSERALAIARLGAAAGDVLARAIARGVHHALLSEAAGGG